jgi:lysophospholipase L1-like esterase
MSNFALDTFTAAAGTTLAAHTPDTGASIAFITGETGTAQITAAGRLRAAVNTGAQIGYAYTGAPTSADYDLLCDLYFASVETVAWSTGIRARIQSGAETYYWARAFCDPTDTNNTTTGIDLYKCVAGTFTRLAYVNYAFAKGSSYRLKLSLRGAAFTVWISTNSGSTFQPLINASDSSILTAGSAGLGMFTSGVLSDTAGCQIDNFTATNAPLPLTVFAGDSYTGITGTLLENHTPDLGAAPTKVTGWANELQLTAAGRVRAGTGGGLFCSYQYPGSPASADYDVVSDVCILSADTVSQRAGPSGRISPTAGTLYWANLFDNAGALAFELYKVVANTTFTQIGTSYSVGSIAAGITYKLKLSMRGSTISAYFSADGGATWTLACTGTDSTITAAGSAGVMMLGETSPSDTTGLQLDNFYAAAPVSIAPNDGAWTSSPGNWLLSSSVAKTTDFGAKRSIIVTGSSFATLNFNVTGFSSFPTIRISIDNGPLNDATLAAAVTAFSGLSIGAHEISYEFLRADYTVDAWNTPTMNVCETGLSLDTTGRTALVADANADRMFVAGDSITQGLNMLSATNPSGHDGTTTWAKALGIALSAEAGIGGKGGVGWAWAGNVPAFTTSWKYQWSGQLRSFGSLKRFVVMMGTNDALESILDTNVTTAVTSWITAARSVLGVSTVIYVVIPFGGFKRNAISAGVIAAADSNTKLIDLGTALQAGLTGPQGTPTRESISDGIHPSVISHGQLGATLAAAIRAAEAPATAQFSNINAGGIFAGL